MNASSKDVVKQIQAIGFHILCDIDQFCTDNNLNYFLSGGSCLGAVRHHGFIPWDDDIDIMLPRTDYQKFLQMFSQTFEDKYGVGCLDLDPNWRRPYARIWDKNTKLTCTKIKDCVMGVFIDVFPIDGMPNDYLSQKMFFAILKTLNVLSNAAVRKDFYSYEHYRFIKKILSHFAKLFGARFFALRIDKNAKRYPFETSKYVGASLALHYGMREKIEKKYMASGIRVPFESGDFPIPIGYDQYLTNLYGDYMTIPKDAEEKGYTHLEGWEVRIKKD